MYDSIYQNWHYENIEFGDFVRGKSKKGIEFNNVQITTVGGGTLGIWFKDIPIEFDPENGGDVILKGTLKLVRKATKEEKIKAGRTPQNEILCTY